MTEKLGAVRWGPWVLVKDGRALQRGDAEARRQRGEKHKKSTKSKPEGAERAEERGGESRLRPGALVNGGSVISLRSARRGSRLGSDRSASMNSDTLIGDGESAD